MIFRTQRAERFEFSLIEEIFLAEQEGQEVSKELDAFFADEDFESDYFEDDWYTHRVDDDSDCWGFDYF